VVKGVLREGRSVRLEPEPFVSTWQATWAREPHETRPKTVADLRRALDGADDLGVRLPDGSTARVIGWERHWAQVGHEHDWAVAVLSAAPWGPASS
jgi:hypothetical protein